MVKQEETPVKRVENPGKGEEPEMAITVSEIGNKAPLIPLVCDWVPFSAICFQFVNNE